MRLHRFKRKAGGDIIVDLDQIETLAQIDKGGHYVTQIGMRSGNKWALDREHTLNDVARIWKEANQPTNLEAR